MTKVECIVKAMNDKLAQDIVAINMENASPSLKKHVKNII